MVTPTVAFFSERPEDANSTVSNEQVHLLEQIPTVMRDVGVAIALVACAPPAVKETLDLLSQAGVRGVVMLTPVLRPEHPDGMNITYFRMPCAPKSLVSDHTPSYGCAVE